ncbi:hypothetical protein D3C80_1946990 [compost metagenome]
MLPREGSEPRPAIAVAARGKFCAGAGIAWIGGIQHVRDPLQAELLREAAREQAFPGAVAHDFL